MDRLFDEHSRARSERELREAQAALHTAQMLNHLTTLQRILARHSHYDPNQLRVPAGHPDGGQWTRVGATARAGSREIASDAVADDEWTPHAQYASRSGRGPRPPMELGQAARLAEAKARADDAIARVRSLDPNWRPTPSWASSVERQIRAYESEAAEAQARFFELGRLEPWRQVPWGRPRTLEERERLIREAAIEAYRIREGLRDLFGYEEDTVAATVIDGNAVLGVNSDSSAFTPADRKDAMDMRDRLVKKYPGLPSGPNIGRMPNAMLFHAESTVLLRAAWANGGTLSGRTLDVSVDKTICNNCETLLPKIALELGNPTVRFTDRTRRTFIIRDGKLWR